MRHRDVLLFRDIRSLQPRALRLRNVPVPDIIEHGTVVLCLFQCGPLIPTKKLLLALELRGVVHHDVLRRGEMLPSEEHSPSLSVPSERLRSSPLDAYRFGDDERFLSERDGIPRLQCEHDPVPPLANGGRGLQAHTLRVELVGEGIRGEHGDAQEVFRHSFSFCFGTPRFRSLSVTLRGYHGDGGFASFLEPLTHRSVCLRLTLYTLTLSCSRRFCKFSKAEKFGMELAT